MHYLPFTDEESNAQEVKYLAKRPGWPAEESGFKRRRLTTAFAPKQYAALKKKKKTNKPKKKSISGQENSTLKGPEA